MNREERRATAARLDGFTFELMHGAGHGAHVVPVSPDALVRLLTGLDRAHILFEIAKGGAGAWLVCIAPSGRIVAMKRGARVADDDTAIAARAFEKSLRSTRRRAS